MKEEKIPLIITLIFAMLLLVIPENSDEQQVLRKNYPFMFYDIVYNVS